MTEPVLTSQQRIALQDLYALIAERARREPQIDAEFQARNEAAEKWFQESCHRVITRFEEEKQSSQKEFEETEQRVGKRFKTERAAQEKEWKEAQARITQQFESDSQATKNEYKAARTASAKSFQANRAQAQSQLREAQDKITHATSAAKKIEREVKGCLGAWKQDRDYGPLPEAARPDRVFQDAFRQLQEALGAAEERFAQFQALRLPRFFDGIKMWVLLGVFVVVGTGAGAALAQKEDLLYGLPIGAVSGLGAAGLVLAWLYSTARKQITRVYQPLRQSLVELQAACEKARDQTREAHQKRMVGAKKLCEKEVRQATEKHKKKSAAAQQRRDSDWQQAEDKYKKQVADSTQRRDTDLRQAHEKFQRLRAEIFERYETDSHQIHEQHFKQMSDSKQRHDNEWQALIQTWQQGLGKVHGVVQEVQRESSRLFPAWDSAAWNNWQPPSAVPPVIHFGDYRVDMAELPDGLSKSERLKPEVPTAFSLPAFLSFPRQCSLLLRTNEDGRAQAVRTLQGVMLRYLTALPAGKVRFTIIDPLGLGENFAAFMHLADYDDALVTSRIWSESAHIEQRLSDLTAHMENVIQKYLRNQFETIEDYNVHAGEVAEPFRIAVIANFPASFGVDAARRLLSILSSGPRCGVYALVSLDTALEPPQGFNMATLEQNAVTLDWKTGRFVWREADFGKYALQLEQPPPDDFSTRVLRTVGEQAKLAKRVEVPFEFIAAAPEQMWTSDSRGGVDVALGRVGATKRQHLRLGKGTSQHVLIAGKTGSGKSTLLHALITNLALFYSPDEVELYLIDFKKGVEFKTYANHELPHARVVSIESDREFGLSVLQRLDAELRLRGEKFRESGAQDLKTYRDANPDARMPRILLVVDEFQEFFLEDDKVSQDTALLLDRLVRQGRAFGLHVLLGSQTLGGAYSLARSTIDQMAVRIALQCSEADGHLILSDDNSAARLLSRPGEAIYNDANGLVEGNNPFQVVWLPEPRREKYLDGVRELDHKRNGSVLRPMIVFEGNAPAEIRKNVPLHDLIQAPAWPRAKAFQAWLGEAMAIKDPTAATFRRQSGSHLLLVGQQDEAALGILATALASLAVQHTPGDNGASPSDARFYLLDGSPADAAHAGALARIAELMPHPVQSGGLRELAPFIAEIAEEVDRRQKSTEIEGPELYVIIHALQRFRDLRRDEDDFGSFSSSSEEQKPSPAKQLATILREGSVLGVHVIVSCDTLNNTTRAFDRQALREFSMRILFQMSANDSSNLIDTPQASRLGAHRAYFHNEEEGRLEKFRPYGLPPEAWLTWFHEQLLRKRVTVLAKQKV
ncbi:MAG TPA: FtsK/SpoIIIE domain-containing protein [Gemmataceae bacterium]|nr:FtsK/SpoIIIE domain-containing protein [Gemmataceae bacterium]